MNKRLLAILLAVCLLLTACASSAEPDPAPADPNPEATQLEAQEPAASEATPEPELTQREKDWREDLEHLKDEYKKYHEDPFYYCTEEEVDWKFSQLEAKINDLTDNELFFELQSIIAGMGDLHTYAAPSASLYATVFPIHVICLRGKFYLAGYQERYEQFAPFLLREIVAVNGVDMAYLRTKGASISHPTNSWYGDIRFASQYFIPAFFDWAGCGYTDSYTIQILNENQERVSVDLPVISYQEYYENAWAWAGSFASMDQLMTGNRAEYRQEPEGSCIYATFNDLSSESGSDYMNFYQEIIDLIDAHPDCDKLAIDLRFNPGGRSSMSKYISLFKQRMEGHEIEHVYVLTGGGTASAAISCITFFKEYLNAVVVGEPTAQFTSFFSYNGQSDGQWGKLVTLPHSQITVVLADRWTEGGSLAKEYYDEDGKLYEWENTILPDVYVYQDIDAIRQGKDSVIQWILAQ